MVSAVIAIGTIALTMRRDSIAERDRHTAHIAERQAVSDKLDTISDMSKETRDTVREMSQQLSNHGLEIARMSERISDHDRRISNLERYTEDRKGYGGTD